MYTLIMRVEKPIGLSGWIIFPIIGFFLSAIVTVFDLFYSISLFGNYGGIMGLYVLCNLILLIFIVGSLVMIFKKSIHAPKFAIITYISYVIVAAYLFAIGIEDTYITMLIGTIIWIWYFSVSERVKNTFVN